MFFDIGWPELLLVGVVALVVIGPKDLPRAMRIAGYWMRKARTLSREFQSSIDQMIREAELDEMRQELKRATELNLESEFQKTVDSTGELAESIRPPNLPDYFDETAPASAEAELALAAPGDPAAESADPEEPELPLPLPTTPAAPQPAEIAGGETAPASVSRDGPVKA